MQFLFHFNSKDTLQLINGIFNALQKLPKYFNGMASSILFLPELFASYLGLSTLAAPPAGTCVESTLYVLPVILFLYLNVFELTTLILPKLSLSLSSLNSSL